ncbi:MAG: LON peptidase substrate-binding domain-containing protein, partial [Bacteroidales bacterium]|nr:LON peptidase substrate-binding domain-containing protein [Bacteroidales bacterium]
MTDKQRILPFFPLGVFLLPGEDLPLRIFEPKYLQLIEEAEQDDFTFVIPFRKDDEIKEYGCEVKLQQIVAESDSGNKVITVESLALVQIDTCASKMTGKLYSGGYVQTLPPSAVIKDQSLIDLIKNYSEHFES